MNFKKILYRLKILINPNFLVLEKRESSSFFFNNELDDFLNSKLETPNFKPLTFPKNHFRQHGYFRSTMLYAK